MVSLITRMVSMKIVWRQCGESYFLWRLCGQISLKIAWGFHGEDMINQITITISILILL